MRPEGAKISMRWGELEMSGAISAGSIQAQDAAFSESRGGKPVSSVRLSEKALV